MCKLRAQSVANKEVNKRRSSVVHSSKKRCVVSVKKASRIDKVDDYVSSVVAVAKKHASPVDTPETCSALEQLLKAVAEASIYQSWLFNKQRGSSEFTQGEQEAVYQRLVQHARLLHGQCQTLRNSNNPEYCLDRGSAYDIDSISRAAFFNDKLQLSLYQERLHVVPGVVNVVTLAMATPRPGSGVTLPLNMHKIATKCVGAYYAPRRFAAVQLGFSDPRCRVLIFHTGRIVGTGTRGVSSARLALCLAQQKLKREAGIDVVVSNMQVINMVAAVDMDTNIDCDRFAAEHTDAAHFDRASFVGLAWRPANEPICIEAYSTGKMNVPGAKSYTACFESFARMYNELTKYTSAALMERAIQHSQRQHEDKSTRVGQQTNVGVENTALLRQPMHSGPNTETFDPFAEWITADVSDNSAGVTCLNDEEIRCLRYNFPGPSYVGTRQSTPRYVQDANKWHEEEEGEDGWEEGEEESEEEGEEEGNEIDEYVDEEKYDKY